MADNRLVWDVDGERFYETGVDQGVLYPFNNGAYETGVAWNGLTAINESPSGAEANPIYADNIKYLNLLSDEDFGFSIEAYDYPDAFAECDGSIVIGNGLVIGQQKRKKFGFSYRSRIGNDEEGSDYGYKIHMVYGCLASPSDKEHSTINESPEAATMSWDVSTTPVKIANYKPTAHVFVNSKKVNETKLAQLERILYGFPSSDVAEWATEHAYKVGDYIKKTGSGSSVTYYICKTDHTSDDWATDTAKWELVPEAQVGAPRLPSIEELINIFDEDIAG